MLLKTCYRPRSEAIGILYDQKRLSEAVQSLNHRDKPSASICSTLVQLCLQQRAFGQGKVVHSHTRASGFVPGLFICNRLIGLYAKCGRIYDARVVFDEMPERNLCYWNTMISGYAKVRQLGEARKLLDEMPQRENISWTAMVSGYAKVGQLGEARKLFDEKPQRENLSWTVMISGCVRHDWPKEALRLFRMTQRSDNSKSDKFSV
ncbi:hypothetical protein TB2_026794 [Malus domestica]